MSLNLESQLVFYGQYHHNPVNVWIHMICVPTLLLTAFLLGTNTPPLFVPPDVISITTLPFNLGTIASIIYASIYVLMEPVAGGLLAPILIAATAFANYLTATYGYTANYWATLVHIGCWIAQFVGHGVFEGRAPALLDNLVQAFLLAPFFVWMEILFGLGYRPNLKIRLDKAVEEKIASYRASKSIDNSMTEKSNAAKAVGQVPDHERAK